MANPPPTFAAFRLLATLMLFIGLLLAAGCIDVTIPAEESSGEDTGSTGGTPVVNPDGQPRVTGADTSGGSLTPTDAGQAIADAGVVLPPACSTHCDCPPDFDCINDVCVVGTMPIQCCTHPKCPFGDTCWTADGIVGVCGE